MIIHDQRETTRPAARSLDAALTTAVVNGERGEAMLVEALRTVSESRRVPVITALGEADGPKGVPALRRVVIDSSACRDERCAGLVALAKREGTAASDMFIACLSDDDATVRRYALRCMACVGDDRAWQGVYRQLWRLLDQRLPSLLPGRDARMLSEPSEIVPAIGYLARHLTSDERVNAGMDLIRSHWERLRAAEQEWVETYWPACVPGCSPAAAALRPNADSVATWLSHPILMPVYLPDG